MKRFTYVFFAIVTIIGILAINGCNRDDDEQLNRQLSEATGRTGGHEWVDLGLPSGTKWATCNVGATSPEYYGDFFAWGETTSKATYSEENYKYAYGHIGYSKYCRIPYDSVDNDGLTTLEAIDDAATANWGAGWRMPTREEMKELYFSCNPEWITLNGGAYGMKFTGPNGNSIFMIAAGQYTDRLYVAGINGHYWSSSLDTTLCCLNLAISLSFNQTNFSPPDVCGRCVGCSVRPVCNQ